MEASRPPSFDTPLLEESEEFSQPPGFEFATLVDSTPMPRKKAPRRHFEVFEKRMTRSQKQLSSILKDKPIQKGIASMTDSSRTSESDIRLAKEALEIGNLLGIKVVDKEDAAAKRITRSPKKSKKALTQEEVH